MTGSRSKSAAKTRPTEKASKKVPSSRAKEMVDRLRGRKPMSAKTLNKSMETAAESLRPAEGSVTVSVNRHDGTTASATLNADGTGSAADVAEVMKTTMDEAMKNFKGEKKVAKGKKNARTGHDVTCYDKNATPQEDIRTFVKQMDERDAAFKAGDIKEPTTGSLEPEAKSENSDDEHPPMLNGVIMRCTLHSSIGRVASKENSRYAIDSVMVLRDNAINPTSTGEPINKKCVFVATDGRSLACSFGTIEEREAASYGQFWSRVPAEYCNLGKKSRVLSLMSSPDQGIFGLERAWCFDGCHCPPVQEGAFPGLTEVLTEINSATHYVIAVNVELLSNLAKALNSVMDDDSGKVIKLIVPRDLETCIGKIAAVGSAGVGLLMSCSVEDPLGWVEKFNSDRIEVLRMHAALPEQVRRALPADEAPAMHEAAAQESEPWMFSWLATTVDKLEISEALKEKLKTSGVNTIGDIQKINAAHPNLGLRSIKRLGATKAEAIGIATNVRWEALKKQHESLPAASGQAYERSAGGAEEDRDNAHATQVGLVGPGGVTA